MAVPVGENISLHGQPFATTHWSLVLAAGHRSSPESDAALESLCRAYWYPLYAYVRRRVCDVHQAQDLTQAFFATIIEKNYIGDAEQQRGRFRSFLLTALKHFLANEWRNVRAQKRGGGQSPLSLDFEQGESRFASEPTDALTPDKVFDREWAVTLMDRVLATLRAESEQVGNGERFDRLKAFLSGEQQRGMYAHTADELGMAVGAVQVAVHRLRRRFGDLLRAEIAQTVAEPSEIDDEIRNLFAAFGP